MAVGRCGRDAVMRAAALSAMGSRVGTRVHRLVSDPSVGNREPWRLQRRIASSLVRKFAVLAVVALLLPGLMVAGTAH